MIHLWKNISYYNCSHWGKPVSIPVHSGRKSVTFVNRQRNHYFSGFREIYCNVIKIDYFVVTPLQNF